MHKIVREAIDPVLTSEEAGSLKLGPAAIRSLMALSLSKMAFSRRRGWLARWWLLRAFLLSPRCIIAEERWRLAAKVLLGPHVAGRDVSTFDFSGLDGAA